jgi:regulator of replication initiation timing
MSQADDLFKPMLELFANPLFRAGFAEFTLKAQQEGIEAAKKFWGLSSYSKAFPFSEEMCERLADWYKAMGFVPLVKYQELQEENRHLQAENQALKNMIRDMQLSFFNEGGDKAREAWQDMVDKQIKMNTELANTFFEAFKPFKSGS